MATYQGDLVVREARFAIVASRFNNFIVERLTAGAMDALVRHGAAKESIDLVLVPGSFEMPLAAKDCASSGRYDAVICVSAIIRGDTPHFEYVAGQAARGLGALSVETGVPVTFGVLTTDTIDQAIERAGTKSGNKGEQAALAAIEMVNLRRSLGRVK
jgi:6,7-dimethyl-8-ribityllumazine synthase